MQSKTLFTRFSLLAAVLGSSWAFAIKVPTGTQDFDLNVSVLLEARAAGSWDGDKPSATGGAAPAGTFDTDFFIRRARLIASGSALKKFTFYIMLDEPNFGIRGNYTNGLSNSAFVQDLHIGYEPSPDFAIEAGFLYMPLSHLALNSSSSTSSIEKPTAILFYNNARGLRETGIQLRTLLLDRRILVRGGLYEGLHGLNGADPAGTPVNPNGRPLVAGTVRLNLIGYETGYSYPSLYMDGKSRVSVGVAGQYQTKGSNTPISSINAAGARVTAFSAVNDYVALSADFFADIALSSDTEVALQADIYRFDWGAGSDKTGYASTVELGYRWGHIEPEVNAYWFNSESRQASFLKVAGGFNYFLKGHQVKLSAEFASIKNNVDFNNSTALHQVLLQAQVAF